jgi:hypothetical protein
MKAKRVHAGCYTYTAGGYTVRVEDRDPNPAFGDTARMWMAIAEWDEHYTFSDPVETKREAVDIARAMLNRKLAA